MALDRTVANIYRVGVRSGEIEQLTHETGMVSGASFDALHRMAAFQFAGPTDPGDLWLANLEAGTKARLTEANPGMAAKDLVEPEVVRWTSSDGLEIEGLLYQPAGRSSPGATILKIHGGPAGVFTRGFDADAQILVTQGYAVLQPNVRGSSGYGDALLRGNMNDIGGGDYEDLMTGVDAIIERGVAHPDSLAVKGWSYGGILGGWTITRTDRFKAASLGAMVADWRSEFGSGFNFDVVRWYLGGDPWSNPDHWTERSAYSHLDQRQDPHHSLSRGQRPHRHHGAVDELLRGAAPPGRRGALHSLPAGGARDRRAASPPHSDDGGDAVAAPVREGHDGLGAAAAGGGGREERYQSDIITILQ